MADLETDVKMKNILIKKRRGAKMFENECVCERDIEQKIEGEGKGKERERERERERKRKTDRESERNKGKD